MLHLAVDDEVLVRARVIMVRGDGCVHVKMSAPSGATWYVIMRPDQLIAPFLSAPA